MLQNILFIVLGLLGLYFGGTLFVGAAGELARRLGMSALMVGLTVVAVGTSLPELIVSVGAATTGRSEIALGNVLGSNIANVGLILGISGLILPLAVHVRVLRRELPIMVGVSVMTLALALDGSISRFDGGILIGGLLVFLIWTIISARQETAKSDNAGPASNVPLWRLLLSLVGGLGLLLIAARLTVNGSTNVARAFGVSELVIGITLVAVGTSLPELVTSVTAALQKQSDIAVGNVVGSNIFNLLGILGTTALISPVPVAPNVLWVDGALMVGFAALLLPFLVDRTLGKFEALLFLLLYLGYTGFLLFAR